MKRNPNMCINFTEDDMKRRADKFCRAEFEDKETRYTRYGCLLHFIDDTFEAEHKMRSNKKPLDPEA